MSHPPEGIAYSLAKEWYAKHHSERDLDADILWYARHHYLYIGDDTLIMAHVWDDHDSWHVFFAISHGVAGGRDSLSKFLDLMPFSMPYITFLRRNEHFSKIKTERFRKLCIRLRM